MPAVRLHCHDGFCPMECDEFCHLSGVISFQRGMHYIGSACQKLESFSYDSGSGL